MISPNDTHRIEPTECRCALFCLHPLTNPLVPFLSGVPERVSPQAALYFPWYGLALVKTALSVGSST